VVCGNPEETAKYIRTHLQDGDGVICFTEFEPMFAGYATQVLGASHDKHQQAQRVFDALRAFDSLPVSAIYAQCPDTAGLGLAVSNRLKKAAGFCVVEV
jgi:L-threonylcarbamoyladenylate synthase